MSGSDSSAGDGDASNDEEEGNKTSVFVVVTIILLSIGVIILCCKWYLKHGFRIPKVCQDLQSWCETVQCPSPETHNEEQPQPEAHIETNSTSVPAAPRNPIYCSSSYSHRTNMGIPITQDVPTPPQPTALPRERRPVTPAQPTAPPPERRPLIPAQPTAPPFHHEVLLHPEPRAPASSIVHPQPSATSLPAPHNMPPPSYEEVLRGDVQLLR